MRAEGNGPGGEGIKLTASQLARAGRWPNPVKISRLNGVANQVLLGFKTFFGESKWKKSYMWKLCFLI